MAIIRANGRSTENHAGYGGDGTATVYITSRRVYGFCLGSTVVGMPDPLLPHDPKGELSCGELLVQDARRHSCVNASLSPINIPE